MKEFETFPWLFATFLDRRIFFYQLYPLSNLLFANRHTDVLWCEKETRSTEPAAVGLPLPDKLVAASDRDITFPAKFTVIPAQQRATYNTQNT